jgi:hypothetical protein
MKMPRLGERTMIEETTMTHAPVQGQLGFDDETFYGALPGIKGWTVDGALVGLIHKPNEVHPHWTLSVLVSDLADSHRRLIVSGGEGMDGRMTFADEGEARRWIIGHDDQIRAYYDLSPRPRVPFDKAA